MGTNNKKLIITPSLIEGNVFYLFKRNGVEVKIEIHNNKVFADKDITKYERDYFERLTRKKEW